MLVAVIISEELARTVVVEAPDVETAERYVDEELYQTGEIVLDANDYVSCSSEIHGVPDSNFSEPDYIVPKDWGK
jgi:hypothetical protein